MNLQLPRAFALVLVAGLLAACDESDSADAAVRDAGSGRKHASKDAAVDPTDAASDATAPDVPADASADGQMGPANEEDGTSERCDKFVAPFDRKGDSGLVVARFVSTTPELVYKGYYNWAVELRQASGEAIGDAELKTKAWMPAHGHGTSPIALRHTAGSSRYELRDVHLFMAGKWEVTLTVGTSAGEDRVEFRACPKDPPDAGDDTDDAGTPDRRGHG